MPGSLRSTAGPVDDRKLAGLIEPVVAAAGMDLESVRMTVAGKRRLLRVVVDSDHGVSLDDAADVSREISAVLDASNVLGDVPYTLEVSSPGVDRPLTEPRHWRRARGRLVRVKVTGEGSVEGRLLAADADGVTLGLPAAASAGSPTPTWARAASRWSSAGFRTPNSTTLVIRSLTTRCLTNDTDLGAGGDGH